MALCKKCGKREQYTSPKGRTVALCSVCGWDAIMELVELPAIGGLTPRAADLATPCAHEIVLYPTGICKECGVIIPPNR
mgnify:FL=1